MTIQKFVVNYTDMQLAEKYSNNAFYKSNSCFFTKLYNLYNNYNADCQFIIFNNNIKLFNWIDNMYDDTYSNYELSFIDKVKLILNDIAHLPNCRCKLDKL